MAAGAAITPYKCPKCGIDRYSGSTFIPKMCRECAIELRLCQRCEADMTIENI